MTSGIIYKAPSILPYISSPCHNNNSIHKFVIMGSQTTDKSQTTINNNSTFPYLMPTVEHCCDPNNVPSSEVSLILSKIYSDDPSTSPSNNPSLVHLLVSSSIISTDPSANSYNKTPVFLLIVAIYYHMCLSLLLLLIGIKGSTQRK